MICDHAKSLVLVSVLGVFAVSVSSLRFVETCAAAPQTPPPDASWMADAAVENPRVVTDAKLGACQGIAVRDGRIYAYGDVYSVKPRVGVIREYDMDLNPTGREIWLRQADRPVIIHPTGLTWDDRWGTLLGDTVNKKARIYRIDWQRAWSDGNLDSAVLDVIDDDAAINGCRPTFVTINGRKLIATADYGEVHPEIRLYDPELLLKSHRSSAGGRGIPNAVRAIQPESPLGCRQPPFDLRSECDRGTRMAAGRDRSGKRARVWSGRWSWDPAQVVHFSPSRRTRRILADRSRPRTLCDIASRWEYCRRRDKNNGGTSLTGPRALSTDRARWKRSCSRHLPRPPRALPLRMSGSR